MNVDQMSGADVQRLHEIRKRVTDVIKAHDEVVDGLFIALFTGGHILLEANPGLGKTSLVKAFAKALGVPDYFGRIQFTPDLMPADITGTLMPDKDNINRLRFEAGPIFKPILLADEINRATPKTQAAMLEAMAEQQVTVLGTTRMLPTANEQREPDDPPFIVAATQNPIDQEGTYELPEAQTDRFMFKFLMRMPPASDLQNILKIESTRDPKEASSKTAEPMRSERTKILKWIEIMSNSVRAAILPPAVPIHISNIVLATNHRFEECADLSDERLEVIKKFVNQYLEYPLGPRAAIQLARAAKGYSTIRAKPEQATESGANIQEGLNWAAVPVLRHRLKLRHGWLEKGRDELKLSNHLMAEEVRVQLVRRLFKLTAPRHQGYAAFVDNYEPTGHT
jgi:MoxR-like ATPase